MALDYRTYIGGSLYFLFLGLESKGNLRIIALVGDRLICFDEFLDCYFQVPSLDAGLSC